ncbi:TRAP transporter large permease [Lachnospiraceae bacterium 62-35]
MIAFLLISFVVLLCSGTGIVAAMGLPAVVYFMMTGTPLSTISYSFYQSLFSFGMVAIPMFMLMGNLVSELGETERGFRLARALAKGSRGYSSKIAIILNLIFAGMSGSSVTAVSGLGPMMIEEMDNEGYDRGYASAMTIAASTVGPVFPPSIPLLLYASIAGISTTKSLIAGMFPGITLSTCLLLWVLFTHKKHFTHEAKQMAEETASIKTLFLDALPIMLAPILIIITMLKGVFSPGECGAMSALYMIILGVFHRTFTFKKLFNSLAATGKSTASVLVLTIAGGTFTKALLLEQLPQRIMGLLGGLASHPILILLLVNCVLLIMGMFMESNSALILAAPIILQITSPLGYNPLHIGVMIVLNLMIGLSTPPFGLCIYTVARLANVSAERVIKNVVPLYVPLLAALLLVTFIPALSNWLPTLILG